MDTVSVVLPQGASSEHLHEEQKVVDNMCNDNWFDYGRGTQHITRDFYWRKCVPPDPQVCKSALPLWAPYFDRVEYESGDRVANAKVKCTFRDIPREAITDKSVSQYLELDSVDETSRDSDLLQATVCMRNTTENCYMDPITKEPMGSCAVMHSTRDPELNFKCQRWWARVKNDGESDEYIESVACPPDNKLEELGMDRLPDDCQCYRANTDPDLANLRQFDVPLHCWYPHCRIENEGSMFQRNDTEPCDTIIQDCDNTVLIGDNVSFINSDIDITQTVNCMIEYTNNDETENDTENEDDDDDDDDDDGDNVNVSITSDDGDYVLSIVLGVFVVMLFMMGIATIFASSSGSSNQQPPPRTPHGPYPYANY